MKTARFFSLLFVALLVLPAFAADHRLEPLSEAAPADELSAGIAGLLSPTGFKVIRGTSRTVCEIWLCKQWSVDAGFEPTSEVLYPFKQGQLIGVARFARKGADFRDQDIGKGVYTLRYAQQPVDGAHVGTSPTRDFLLLVSAKADKSGEMLDLEALVEKSQEAAESSHPAMLCLQRVAKAPSEKASIRHNEEHDWWILAFTGTAKAGAKKSKLPVELVVVGVSSEQ